MTVVVGVDVSPDAYAAIRLARREADYRGVRLIAVMARGPESSSLGAPAARPLSTRSAGEERKLAESTLRLAIHDALGGEDSSIERRVVTGVPGRVLVETARTTSAELIVLTNRREKATSRLLGAVSQYVLRNAPCPVLVVPEASQDT